MDSIHHLGKLPKPHCALINMSLQSYWGVAGIPKQRGNSLPPASLIQSKDEQDIPR